MILEASSMPAAGHADDLTASLAMPCQVVLRRCDDDHVKVDFMNPGVLIDLVGAKIFHITEEVRTRFEKVRDAVATASA